MSTEVKTREHRPKNPELAAIYDYWNSHTLGLQYATDHTIKPGTREFFDHIRQWMNPYKFPWIMDRIDQEAKILRGKHLLEIGWGMTAWNF